MNRTRFRYQWGQGGHSKRTRQEADCSPPKRWPPYRAGEKRGEQLEGDVGRRGLENLGPGIRIELKLHGV